MLFTCLNCSIEFNSKKKCKSRIPKFCSRKCFQSYPVSNQTKEKQSGSRLGKEPWNKGIKMWNTRPHPKGTLGKKGIGKGKIVTLETRIKQSNAHLGIKLPERSGSKHPLWKGGITPKNEAIRKSSDYSNWRRKIFERDNFTCVICKKVGGTLNADHIIPFCESEEKRFDLDNGRTLCTECHLKTDTFGGKIHRKRKKLC